jgi:murein DD-endopeptidase MepM/ murein hydrolase activator NlpD
MLQTFKLLVAIMLFAFSSFSMAANEATGFVYPVGNLYVPPTEQSSNGNGFHISQNFNTGSVYGGSSTSPNGGWCSNTAYTSKTDCEANGYKWIYGHTGVDLAKDGGGSCGEPIHATSNGVVVFSGPIDGYGYLLKIKHVLPNGRTIYSIYGHRQSATMSAPQVVTKGQIVGYVGDTGTVRPDGTVLHDMPCHLHFAIIDQAMPGSATRYVPPGYVYDDSGQSPDIAQSNIMRYFYDPLLFVNDRNNESQMVFMGTGYSYTIFSSTKSVTTRTMFVTDAAGNAESLQAAVDLGWIGSVVYWWNSYSWVLSTGPIESQTVFPGYYYAFYALRSGLTLHWFIPGNDYLNGRWLRDMAEFTTVNASLGFGRALRDSYNNNPNWSTSYSLAYMTYEQKIGGTLYGAFVDIAYLKTNPLVRYVCYYNPQTGVWSSWVKVH